MLPELNGNIIFKHHCNFDDRERMMMQTPISIYSLGSTTSSRQTSASELNFERTPHSTPQAWGHGPPPMDYYGRESTNGSWANQTMGRQALVRRHSVPIHQVCACPSCNSAARTDTTSFQSLAFLIVQDVETMFNSILYY